MLSFQANFRATRELGYREPGPGAIESSRGEAGSGRLRNALRHLPGVTFPAPGLTGPDGNPAVVRINFEVNENTLAPEYGPVEDIDGDGAKNTGNAKKSYVLLPTG